MIYETVETELVNRIIHADVAEATAGWTPVNSKIVSKTNFSTTLSCSSCSSSTSHT